MKRFLALSFAVILSGCASLYDEPVQKVEIKFANDAQATSRCIVDSKHQKEQIEAPGVVTVQRMRDPLIVYCLSANGREASQVVPAQINKTSKYNAANLGVGFVYDAFSDTAWAYPDVIVMDFEPKKETILESIPVKTYSDTVWEQYEDRREEIIEKTRALFSQGTAFEVKETRRETVIVPENVTIKSKRSHISQPIVE